MPVIVPILLVIALFVVVVGDGLIIAERLYRYRHAPSLHVLDRSDLNVPPPPSTRGLVDELSRLGFIRLGEAGLPEQAKRRGPVQVWYFADRERTTVGGVFVIGEVLGHAMVYSWFGDAAVMVTGHRRGEEIDETNFRFRVVDGTLTEAYRQHLAGLPDFAMHYGKPRKLEDMAEILRLDSHYNQMFARRRMRRSLVQAISRPALLTFALLALLAAYFISTALNPNPVVLIAATALAIGLAALGYAWLLRRAR